MSFRPIAQDMERYCSACGSTQEVEFVSDSSDVNMVMCLTCGAEFVDVGLDSNDIGQHEKYKNFVVARVISVESIAKQKDLKKVMVDIGNNVDLQIVTNAKYLEVGWIVVVALENAIVPAGANVDEDTDAIIVTKRSVGGVSSFGMLCDSPMLSWTGGAKGIVQQLPSTFTIGSMPPSSRPRLE